jgi:hypothetical protein
MLSLCCAVLLAGTAPLRARAVGSSERDILREMLEEEMTLRGFRYQVFWSGARMRGERLGIRVGEVEVGHNVGAPRFSERVQIAVHI